jgi:hypothetical protein
VSYPYAPRQVKYQIRMFYNLGPEKVFDNFSTKEDAIAFYNREIKSKVVLNYIVSDYEPIAAPVSRCCDRIGCTCYTTQYKPWIARLY